MQQRVPLFVKEGAVIPLLSKSVVNTEQAIGHPLELRHYGRQSGRCSLYEDDGKTYAYETGVFRRRAFTVSEQGMLTESTTKPEPKLFGDVDSVVQMTKAH